MINETVNPIVPVYLNQRIIFDMLAMLQGGIATVTKVSEKSSNESAISGEASGSLGLNKAFSSLFSINLSGKGAAANKSETGTTKNEERVHTTASLFYKLRDALDTNGSLKTDGPEYTPSPGDIIEFCGSLQRNPVIEAIEFMANALGMADVFSDNDGKSNKQKRKEKKEGWELKEQISRLVEDLKSGGTVDLVGETMSCGYRAIITAEADSLNDPSMSDLVDGTFCVVGKVIRSIPDTSSEINLLRKSTLGRLAGATLDEAFANMESVREEHGIDIPEMIRNIQGPVIQVLPVAIFA